MACGPTFILIGSCCKISYNLPLRKDGSLEMGMQIDIYQLKAICALHIHTIILIELRLVILVVKCNSA